MRYLVGSVLDWTALYKEAYKALKPGGWLESFEGSPHMVSDDGTIPVKSAIAQWGRFFEEGGRKTGRSFLVVDEDIQYRAMQEAGFVDIQEWEFKVCLVCDLRCQTKKVTESQALHLKRAVRVVQSLSNPRV